MGMDYSYLAVERKSSGFRVIKISCKDAIAGGREINEDNAALTGSSLLLRVKVTPGAICNFSYAADGEALTPIGQTFTAREGRWIGAKVGLFALADSAGQESGYADFDWFRFD